jgi:RNA polymerase sigma-70 factor (ECF subfamily)
LAPGGSFPRTSWSTILRSRDGDDPNRHVALNLLCLRYWRPLYVYVRRRGKAREEAEDITQGFFAFVLEKRILDRVDPLCGRFRSYLVRVLTGYLANEGRVRRAKKRGGTAKFPIFDFDDAEERFAEVASTATPEAAYERAWAATVLERAVDKLRRELTRTRSREAFEAVRGRLGDEEPDVTNDELARRADLSPVEFKNLLFGARKRVREIVENVLRETVDTEEDLQLEIRDLFDASTRRDEPAICACPYGFTRRTRTLPSVATTKHPDQDATASVSNSRRTRSRSARRPGRRSRSGDHFEPSGCACRAGGAPRDAAAFMVVVAAALARRRRRTR